MKKIFIKITKDEDGQAMVEYGLILAGIAMVVLTAIWLLGPKLALLFSNITNSISNP